jgi:hypothetical protein
VKAFFCPRCGSLVYFENVACLQCGAKLGFDPERREMVRTDTAEAQQLVVHCANQERAGCNWLVAVDEEPPAPGGRCRSCRLTRTRPNDADLQDPHVWQMFVRAEAGKRRLVFQLLDLALPLDPGPAFDFLVRRDQPITIGHADGVITIDLAESDDAYRERMRIDLHEPYRTMLGHLRHEVGHYYWQVLVAASPATLAAFRDCFGDERTDYQEALTRHYDDGPSPGWEKDHVSAYAAAHPWEDWAETWAHYLHIGDTLQTAAAYGVIVTGPQPSPVQPGLPTEPPTAAVNGGQPVQPGQPGLPVPLAPRRPLDHSLMASPSLDRLDSDEGLDDILADWLPLTYALNAINRSMGKDDLYPFVLTAPVIVKLRLVHECVRACRTGAATPSR